MCWLGSVWLPGTVELINSGTNNKDIKLNKEDNHSRAGSSVPHPQGHWVGISKSLLGFPFCSQDGSTDPGTPSFITSSQGRTREKPRTEEGLHTPPFSFVMENRSSHKIPVCFPLYLIGQNWVIFLILSCKGGWERKGLLGTQSSSFNRDEMIIKY